MCKDIRITRHKTVTMYKVAIKIGKNKFISPIVKTPIKLGSVPEIRHYDDLPANNSLNKEMFDYETFKNKITGLKFYKDVKELKRAMSIGNKYSKYTLLRIKLAGEIYKGTTGNITFFNDPEDIAYAGTIITSIEEIKT